MSASAIPSDLPRHSFPYFTLIMLVLCQIGLQACMTGMRMSAPLQALQNDHGAGAVGVLMAMFAILPVVLALPAGRMADRYGYHRPVRVAVCLSFSGALIASLSNDFVSMCVAAALCGAGSSFGLIALQRTAGRMARGTGERLKIFSLIAIAPALASLVGPLGTGLLIDHLGFRAAFMGLAALPLATLLLSVWVPHETPTVATAIAGPKPPAWDLLRSPPFRRLLFINWLVSASWDVHSFVLPILGHERGLSASTIGSILSAYAVTSTLVRLCIIPLLAHRLSQRAMIAGALLLTAAVYAIYPLLGSAWAMALGTGVLGLALGSIQPAIMTTLHHVTPVERQGEGLAVRSMTVYLSSATTPLLFGLVGAAVGALSLFWLMGGALLVGCWQARRIGGADEG